MKALDIDLIEDLFYLQSIQKDSFLNTYGDVNTGFTYPVLSARSRGNAIYIYGYPRTRNNFMNIIVAFPSLVWLLILLSTAAGVILFLSILFTYRHLKKDDELLTRGASAADLLFQVVGTLTEPEGVHIFPHWSTGENVYRSLANEIPYTI